MQATIGHGPLISVVDDDEGVRLSLDGLLRSAGLKSKMFGSAEEALTDPHIRDLVRNEIGRGISGWENVAADPSWEGIRIAYARRRPRHRRHRAWPAGQSMGR